jgi:pimeloyl-ACP methyl ester carboxylesterase
MSTTAEVRSLAVGGQAAASRGAAGCCGSSSCCAPARRPLLLINGIGASLELLEPFVRRARPGVEVIRFDPPGVGGSPSPRPVPVHRAVRLIAGC